MSLSTGLAAHGMYRTWMVDCKLNLPVGATKERAQWIAVGDIKLSRSVLHL